MVFDDAIAHLEGTDCAYTAEKLVASKELEDASTLYLFEGTQSVMPVDAEVVETVEEVAETVSDEATEVVDEVVEAVSDETQGYIAVRAYTDDEGNQVAEFMDFFAIENVEEAVEAIAE